MTQIQNQTQDNPETGGSALAHPLHAIEDLRWGLPFANFLGHEWSDLLDRAGGVIRVERTIDENDLIIRAEVPGVDPAKDIHLTLDGDMLTIHAVRRDERHQVDDASRRSEFHYGAATRRLRVPAGVAVEDIRAAYKDGILEVRVPRPAPVSTEQEISIQYGEA